MKQEVNSLLQAFWASSTHFSAKGKNLTAQLCLVASNSYGKSGGLQAEKQSPVQETLESYFLPRTEVISDLLSKDVAFHKWIIPINALMLFFNRQLHDANSSQYTVHLYLLVLMWYPSFQVSDVIQSETKRFGTTSINYLKRLWEYIVHDNYQCWRWAYAAITPNILLKKWEMIRNNNSTIFLNHNNNIIVIITIIISGKAITWRK